MMANADLKQFDHWLEDDGPAAIAMREWLVPVDGRDGVIFPATFAASEGQKEGGYNIDDVGTPSAPRLVALVDSVGSQANRIEPLFKRTPYDKLVPQIRIKAGEQVVNLLDAGHRAADAIVRNTEIAEQLAAAFAAWQRKGDASAMAKVAPTSLLFGAWDSRGTQAKLPRLFSSTIRAFDVKSLKRSAQYIPPTDYVAGGLVEEPREKKDADALSALGFQHAPAAGTHGGIIVQGEIRRDVVLSLVGVRALGGETEEQTKKLQRYVLGLGLIALGAPRTHDLRQGCLLVRDPDHHPQVSEVGRDGTRKDVAIDFERWCAFAESAAGNFGVGPSKDVEFDKKKAAAAIKEQKESKNKKKGSEA